MVYGSNGGCNQDLRSYLVPVDDGLFDFGTQQLSLGHDPHLRHAGDVRSEQERSSREKGRLTKHENARLYSRRTIHNPHCCATFFNHKEQCKIIYNKRNDATRNMKQQGSQTNRIFKRRSRSLDVRASERQALFIISTNVLLEVPPEYIAQPDARVHRFSHARHLLDAAYCGCDAARGCRGRAASLHGSVEAAAR